MNKLHILTFLIFLPFLIMAQSTRVGVSLGLTNYQGDIASVKVWSPEELNFAANLSIQRELGAQWSLRGNLLLGKWTGDDLNHTDDGEWRARRGYDFETKFQELTAIAEWQFLNGKKRTKGFHPYLMAGAGVLFSKPNEEERSTNFAIPLGVGFMYDLTDRWAIGLEVSSRVPFSDQLDGFSREDFSEGNDWYTFVGVGVSYEIMRKYDKMNDIKLNTNY